MPSSFCEQVHIHDDCAQKRVASWVDTEDAPLIQAAPELLAALDGLLADPYLSTSFNNDRMAPARAAIAKARGQA